MSRSARNAPKFFSTPCRRRYSVNDVPRPADPMSTLRPRRGPTVYQLGTRPALDEGASTVAWSPPADRLLLRLGLGVVALRPLGEDALAVVGGVLEVHLDEALLV